METNITKNDAINRLDEMDIIVAQQNLIYYIQMGDTNVVKLLLLAGLNPNAIYQNDKAKLHPLHHSIEKNQLECTKLLLKNGADVNIKNDKKESPLFIAIKLGNIEAVNLLIEFGADLNQKGEEKTKPLFYAEKQKQFEIHKLLKESGAEEMNSQEIKVHKRISNANTIIAYSAISIILFVIIFIGYALIFGGGEDSKNDNSKVSKSKYVLHGVSHDIDINTPKNNDGARAASEACQWVNLWKMANGGHYKEGSYINGVGRMNGVKEDGDKHLDALGKYLLKYSKESSKAKNIFLLNFKEAYNSCSFNERGTIPPIVKNKFREYGLKL